MYNTFVVFIQVGSLVCVQCYHEGCSLTAHVTCLAPQLCRESDHLIPISGDCPMCGQELMWGELIKRSKRTKEKKRELENVCLSAHVVYL